MELMRKETMCIDYRTVFLVRVNAFCLLGIDENFTASMTTVYTWRIIIHLDKSHKKWTSVADATSTNAV